MLLKVSAFDDRESQKVTQFSLNERIMFKRKIDDRELERQEKIKEGDAVY